ncbi:hypothetical protein [Aquimarina latercula]|uniref:hypothetical protein n=1 Tax=Aquimarina latercula TaxID=987 RepID=UPI000426357B|nr:hypothetical protein [Aquimarina latercula]
MDQKKETISYADLQTGIDRLISKFGMSKTLGIIRQLTGQKTSEQQQGQRAEVVMAFIISESHRLFDSEMQTPSALVSKEFSDARMTAYHLTKKYTGLSYRQMGKPFGQSKRAVIYHYKNCEEMLSVPQFHKVFIAIYKSVEENVIEFITQ